MKSQALLLMALASSASTAFCQTPNYQQWNVTSWPTAQLGPPAAFTRTGAGEFTNDGQPDAFVLSGNKVVWLYDASDWNSCSVVASSVNDFSVARKRGVNMVGGPPQRPLAAPLDGLATVDAGGLKVYRLELWGSLPWAWAVTTLSSNPLWVNARRVCAADLDGVLRTDFVGVEAGGKIIVLHKDGVGDSSFGTVSEQDVLDLVALDWIPGGPQEFAVLTRTRVEVYDGNGALLAQTPLTLPQIAGSLVAVRSSPGGPEWLVWLQPAQQFLYGLMPSTGQLGPWSYPLGAGAVSLSANDADGDGKTDILVTFGGTYDRYLLLQQPGPFFGPNFSTIVSCPEPRVTPSIPNTAQALFTDLDGDIDETGKKHPEILLPVYDTPRFEVLMNYDTLLHLDIIQSGIYIGDPPLYPRAEGSLGAVSLVNLVVKIQMPQQQPNANYLDVVLWTQPAQPDGVDPNALSHWVYPLPQPWPVGGNLVFQATLPAHNVCSTTEVAWPIYWFEVRQVYLASDLKTILTSYPKFPCAVAWTQADAAYLETLLWIKQLLAITLVPACTSFELPDQREPIIRPRRKIPQPSPQSANPHVPLPVEKPLGG